MSQQKTLILGGARSGKTAHALKLCETYENRIYVATAQPGDDEMRKRIAIHAAERGKNWTTVESPLDLAETINCLHPARQPGANALTQIILVDCLTLWLSNVMLSGADVTQETDALIVALNEIAGPIILVSNEVGLSIVPDNPLARKFRDAQGRLNQRIAATCDTVEFIAAGLPVRLKP